MRFFRKNILHNRYREIYTWSLKRSKSVS